MLRAIARPIPVPSGFCRKEWLEKLLRPFRWESRDRIAHAEANLSVSIATGANDEPPRIRPDRRDIASKAFMRQIQQHLEQLHAIRHYTGRLPNQSP